MTHRRTQLRSAFVDRLKDATAAEEGVHADRLLPVDASPVHGRTFMAPTSELQPGADPLAIGYTWLKAQPEYAAAQDA